MRFLAPPPTRAARSRGRPTFSVVIPAYQAAATAGDAVKSALDQTRPPLEVIVVDDGSTDNLAGALAEYEGRIKLITKENGGAASALNAAVRVASGEFTAILDADDAYHPRRLEAMSDLAVLRPDLDILTTDTEFIVQGKRVGRFYSTFTFPTDNQREAILHTCFTLGCPAIRRSRLLEVSGFDEDLRTAYDWDILIRLILDGSLAGLADGPYLEYRLRAASLTSRRVEALWDRVRILEKARRSDSLQPGDGAILDRALARHATRAAMAAVDAELHAGRIERGRVLRLATAPHLTRRARVLLAAAAVAPRYARVWIPHDPGPLERRLAVPPG